MQQGLKTLFRKIIVWAIEYRSTGYDPQSNSKKDMKRRKLNQTIIRDPERIPQDQPVKSSLFLWRFDSVFFVSNATFVVNFLSSDMQ